MQLPSFDFSTPGLRALEFHRQAGHLFHGGRAGIERFMPKKRVWPGYFYGRLLPLTPLIFATKAPLLAATLAWSRDSPTWGLGYCTHQTDTHSASVSFTSNDADQPMDSMRRRLKTGLINSGVYVFEPGGFSDRYPHPFEFVSRHEERPIDFIRLTATDLEFLQRHVLPLNQADGLFPLIVPRPGHDPFTLGGPCYQGGHIRFGPDGAMLPPYRLGNNRASEAVRMKATELRDERVASVLSNPTRYGLPAEWCGAQILR
jgi:hypothetical protein